MDGERFLKEAYEEFLKYKETGNKVFAQLTDADFYSSTDAFNNNIAINIAHLHGNMVSRWTNFLTEDGEKEWRQRDAEFETPNASKAALVQLWEDGWQVLLSAVQSITPQDLDKTISIRNQPLTVTAAILRQLTHHASHVGQIILLGKHIKGENWQTLSIPAGQSKQYNNELKSK